jgi:hypothetical protein
MSRRQNILGKVERLATAAGQAELDVTVSVEIEAERHRLLYALTIPEYMEAWLQIPTAETLQCFSEPKATNSFHIALNSAEVPSAGIEVFCLLLNLDRIIYLWKSTCGGGESETVVDIRIGSSLDKCAVNLSHSGFGNVEESLWHSRMWRSSLNNLCRLMTAVSGTTHTGTALRRENSSGIHPAQSVVSTSAYRRS